MAEVKTKAELLDLHSKLVADMAGQRCANFMRMATEAGYELDDLLDDLGLTPDMKYAVIMKHSMVVALAMSGEEAAAQFRERMTRVVTEFSGRETAP